MSAEAKLKEMGLELPTPPAPLANYVPAVRTGNLIFTAGQLPMRNGELIAKGKCGTKLNMPNAQEAARQCALNALAVIRHQIGSLDKVKQIVKLNGFVNSAYGFVNQPSVIDGASDLLVEIFGDKGKHARLAVGVRELPKDAPVELELIVEVVD